MTVTHHRHPIWLTLVICCWLLIPARAQRDLGFRPTQSGGVLTSERAAYDVISYDLSLKIDPEERSIDGRLIMRARILYPVRSLVLDLDDRLEVHSIEVSRQSEKRRFLDFEHNNGEIRVTFPTTRQPQEEIELSIDYAGKPREAARPPWVGGFVWEKTASGEPWVSVACQVDGADLWWPNKDHPSDEPDEMDLRFTVPASLIVASNGTLRSISSNADGTRTHHWHVANPINAYNVTLNAAPYRTISGSFESITGRTIPLTYWVLPENYEDGERLFEQFPRHLRFLEETVGPYPFQNEKYGVAETPYLGMEHQTIIAYGNRYRNNKYGFDSLHFHELAHEWWGNLVTVSDWSDYWIHEGFASYMEALYAEHLAGSSALHEYLKPIRRRLRNLDPVAPRESRSTVEKYFVPPDYTHSDGDVNFKGAWILHTLRFLVGDETFSLALKRFAYPEPWQGRAGARCRCRFASTEDFRYTVEHISGLDLDWFFEVYLRQAMLPRLRVERKGDSLHLRWVTPDNLPFPMPVEVKIGGRLQRIEMPQGRATVPAPAGADFTVDPKGWILKEEG